MDNAKPCGGAIPVCMIEEFSLPPAIIDRKASALFFDSQHLLIMLIFS